MAMVRNPRTGEMENIDSASYAQRVQRALGAPVSLPQEVEMPEGPESSGEAAPSDNRNDLRRAFLANQASEEGVKETGYSLDPNYYNPDGTEKKPKFQNLKKVMGGR